MANNQTFGTTLADYELALEQSKSEVYVLDLYVSGISPKSVKAITNVKNMCERCLSGRYELKVIDVYQKPTMAVNEQIVAVPTLIKKLPKPVQRLMGDMANIQQVLLGLEIRPKERAVHEKRRDAAKIRRSD